MSNVKPQPRPNLDDQIKLVSEQEGVPYEIYRRLIFQESSDNHYDSKGNVKRSPKGAMGYAQLMPATAQELGVDPKDPFDNLRGGARYLKQQLERFDGDIVLAVAAYNAGPTITDRVKGVPDYPETVAYVSNILGIAPEQLPTVDMAAVERGDFSPRPKLRPDSMELEDLEVEPELVAKKISTDIYVPMDEEKSGIQAFEDYMPYEDGTRAKGIGGVYPQGPYVVPERYKRDDKLMTLKDAAEEDYTKRQGIGPLNYVARNMFLNKLN